jgi:hypothetical protein
VANLDFFAVREDMHALFDALFAEVDVRVFESYSAFGEKLRAFRSFGELADAYPDIGKDRHGNGHAITLQLWCPAAGKRPRTKRIDFTKPIKGATFRYNIDGWALMQLYLGGTHKKVVTKSHFGHNSFERARKWGSEEGVDWKALEQTSRKIQSIIRTRLAVARVPGRSVLAGAYALAKRGITLVEMAQGSVRHEITWVSPRASS